MPFQRKNISGGVANNSSNKTNNFKFYFLEHKDSEKGEHVWTIKNVNIFNHF